MNVVLDFDSVFHVHRFFDVFPGCFKPSYTFEMPCRLHHTFSALSDGRVFVFGGRLSPAKPMCDTQILSLCLSADGWLFFYPDALIV